MQPAHARRDYTAGATGALDALYVIYPGDRRDALADRIEAMPLACFVGAT